MAVARSSLGGLGKTSHSNGASQYQVEEAAGIPLRN